MIAGPIANDTIFDTMGMITSGLLRPEDSLKLLQAGPEYPQIVLKTEKAASQLHWIGSRVLSSAELERIRVLAAAEEEQYLSEFAGIMEQL